jgi:hypothetical protein
MSLQITSRNDRPGKDQRRAQRSDDDVFRFANNNRGDWEKMLIEKEKKVYFLCYVYNHNYHKDNYNKQKYK